MPQPVTYNVGTNIIGSIQAQNISYAVDGEGNNYRTLDGKTWQSEIPAINQVVFATTSNNIGKGPTGTILYWASATTSSADIISIANQLPGSPRNFNNTASVYQWASTNGWFVTTPSTPFNSIVTDGLDLYLTADSLVSYPTTGSTWYDLSGNTINGTLTNGPTFDSAGAIVFDGIDDYAAVGTLPNVSTFCTVNALVRRNPSVATTNGALFGFGTTAGNTQDIYYWANYPGASYQFGFNTWNGDSWGFNNSTASGEVMDGRWHCLTAVFNRNNITGSKIYVDGISKTLSQVFGTTLNRSVSSNFGIAYNGWNTPNQLFNGDISSVEVYERELSQSEILQNYYGGPIITDGLVLAVDAGNLVSYESGSTVAYNLTGSLNGSLVNGTGYSNDSGGTWVFDGVDDVINTDLTQTFTDELTVETWYRGTKTTRNHLWNLGSSVVDNLNCNLNDSGRTLWMYWQGGGNNAIRFTSPNFTDNNIHHLVFRHSGSVNQIYFDGQLLNPQETLGTQTFTGGGVGGSYNIGGSPYFGGNVYANRVYNRALTSDEVLQNYNATKIRFGL